MVAHPLLVTVLVIDALALVLLAVAVPTAVAVLLRWAPAETSRAQLRLEARAEGASILGRAAGAALLLSTLAFVVSVTSVLPSLVPGAMCGTGVLQATGGVGGRALALRCAALGLLGAWHLIDGLNRSAPRATLATSSARALLLAVPLVLLGVIDTARAFWRLDLHQPVDCCAAVYDQVRASSPAAAGGTASDALWLWTALAGGVVLMALGLWVFRQREAVRRNAARALALGALLWAPVAAIALVRVLAAYHYQVLRHHCPWCLFLPEHYAVGYPLFAALAVALFEGPAALLAAHFARAKTEVAAAAQRRFRRAGLHVVLSVFAFWLLAGLPPLIWRLRFGTWMS